MARTDTEQLVVSLEARIAAFEKNMAKANATAQRNFGQIERRSQRSSRRINQHMASATAGVTKLGGALKGLVAGFGVGFGVAGLQRLVTDSLAAADSIDKASQAADVSARFLQEMRFAASQSGVEARGLDDSLRRLTRRVGLFISEGGGPAEKALQRLGLASRITSGQLRGTEPIFDAVVKSLQGVENQAEKSALAAQLFGDDYGPKLLPLLNQGIDGIAAMRAEAERLGIVMNDALIKKAVQANDALDRMGFILRTNTSIAVVELVDDIRTLGEEIAPIIDWLFRLADTFEGVGEALSSMDLFGNTIREIRTFKELLRSLGADIKEVPGEVFHLGTGETTGGSKPLRIDIRDDSIPGPNRPAGVGGSAPRTIPPSPAKPSFIVGTFTSPLGNEEAERKLAVLRAHNRLLDDATSKTNELTAAQVAAANAGQQFALTVSQGLTGAITGATTFKDAVTGIIQQLAEAIIQAIIFRSITGAFGGGATAGATGAGLLGAFAGGFASGGTIPAGQWGIVGERGPEPVFGPATVVPNMANRAGQPVAITNTINVNVEGGSRGEEADRELANKIGTRVNAAIDSRITEQIRQQLRPGNILNPVRTSL